MRELLEVVWITTMTFPVFYHSFYLLYIYIVVCTIYWEKRLLKQSLYRLVLLRGFFRVEEFTDLLVFVNYV